MAGVPADITFNATKSGKAHQAALMMAAQNTLSHTPGSGWACYTAAGAEAAGKSNLALGSSGPKSINQYIQDSGANNTAVGHRRWILSPRVVEMGTGDIPSGPTPVAGIALAPGVGIAAVEVSVDDGPWQTATLGNVASDDTWVQWRWVWDATPGEHTLSVRATDRRGEVQTAERAAVAPDGATGHHRRRVTVRA